MSFGQATALVARREITERVRQRSFLVSSAVTLLIVAAAAVLPALLGGGPTTYDVGVVGSQPRAVAAAAGVAGSETDVKIDVKRLPGRAKAEKQVRDGDLDAALVGPRQVVSDDKLPDELAQALQLGARQVASGEALRKQGLSRAQARRALDPPSLRTRTLAGDSQDTDQRKFIALAAALLLYGQLLTYGLWVATGVVEEKASRVVEILLATLSPRALMAGKIVGLGVLGAGQMLLVVVLGLALALATGSLEATGGDVAPVLLVLLWFPLGYALYASLYAAAGALVSRQEDLQSATTPLTVLIIASFFLSFSALNDPGGPVATAASLVPFSAPLVMPGRMVLGEASPAEVAAAVVLLVAATILLVRVGARVYSGAVLRTGKPVKLREALRASRS